MEPMKNLKLAIERFELQYAKAYAAAAVDIPTLSAPDPGDKVTKVVPSGIRVLFRPDQGCGEDERGLWVSGPGIGAVRLRDAPAEVLIRGCDLLAPLAEQLDRRAIELHDLAQAVADKLG